MPQLPTQPLEPPIHLTPAAEEAVRAAIAESGRLKVLRVAFLYGCGGAGYRTSLELGPSDGDMIWTIGPLTLSMDPMAASSLEGGTLDCVEGDEGPELLLDHPNALGAPMCGW